MEIGSRLKSFFQKNEKVSSIASAGLGQSYKVRDVHAERDMRNFLFTLGCYPGEEITLISKLADNFVINIKDARYSIDRDLAKAIIL